MDIPFLDLKGVNAKYREKLIAAFIDVLDSGNYILGHRVEEFETKLSAYCGVPHTIGVGNGFDALQLILRGYKELGILGRTQIDTRFLISILVRILAHFGYPVR